MINNYKENLAFQPLLDNDVISLVEALQYKSFSHSQFHSKKKVHKNKNELSAVLRMVVAWEIYKLLEKCNG